jgi:hypothetical protein
MVCYLLWNSFDVAGLKDRDENHHATHRTNANMRHLDSERMREPMKKFHWWLLT